jgi:hypothetical protein
MTRLRTLIRGRLPKINVLFAISAWRRIALHCSQAVYDENTGKNSDEYAGNRGSALPDLKPKPFGCSDAVREEVEAAVVIVGFLLAFVSGGAGAGC